MKETSDPRQPKQRAPVSQRVGTHRGSRAPTVDGPNDAENPDKWFRLGRRKGTRNASQPFNAHLAQITQQQGGRFQRNAMHDNVYHTNVTTFSMRPIHPYTSQGLVVPWKTYATILEGKSGGALKGKILMAPTNLAMMLVCCSFAGRWVLVIVIF